MSYYEDFSNQVESSSLNSSALSGNVDSPRNAFLDESISRYAQRVGQKRERPQAEDPRADRQQPGRIDAESAEMVMRDLKREASRQPGHLGAEHESNRAEMIYELSKRVRQSTLSDSDKTTLRTIERSLIDGDLATFENTIRKLPDAQRAYLLHEADGHLRPFGYEIFQVRAASKADGGNVGDHDFVVQVRHGGTVVEAHTDLRVPCLAVADAQYMPRVAVSDTVSFPARGTPGYVDREETAKRAFQEMANGAVCEFDFWLKSKNSKSQPHARP